MARSRKSVDALIGAALAAPGARDGEGPLAVAFSGGLDSTVLLHAATSCLGASRVLALHVHHGLQPQADAWVAHCAARAAALGVAFRTLHAAGAPAPGESIEGWAREVRYALLLAAAREAGACALTTAHHADDQAETLLLALGRGCGLDGLTGISPFDRRKGVVLLRPLLELGRDALLEHALSQGLDWVEDPSNADMQVARSALRRQGLPALESVLPGWAQAAPATVQALRDARAIVDERAAQDLSAAVASGGATLVALDRRVLASLPGVRIDAVLRAWLSALGETAPSRAKLAEVRAQLVDGECSSAVQRHGAHWLYRYRDLLWADRGPLPSEPGPRALQWSGEAALQLGDAGTLCFESASEGLDADWLRTCTLHVGPIASSARLRREAGGPSRTIKNLRQEAGLPPALRAAFPGVSVNGRLLWAAPFGRDRDPVWPTAARGIALRFEPAASSPACAWAALSAASSR